MPSVVKKPSMRPPFALACIAAHEWPTSLVGAGEVVGRDGPAGAVGLRLAGGDAVRARPRREAVVVVERAVLLAVDHDRADRRRCLLLATAGAAAGRACSPPPPPAPRPVR